MRIAIVSQPYYPQRGGVSEHVHHSAGELRRLGHDVDIVTSRFRGDRDDGPGLLRIGRNVLVPHLGAFANVSAGWGLSRKLGRILERDYDVVHVHEPLSPTLPLMAVSRTPGTTALVGTFHASSHRDGLYRVFRTWLDRYARRLDTRIAVSAAAERYVSGVFPGRYRIVPNGVDPHRFRPDLAPHERHSADRPTILFVGRFYPRKGLQILLSALPKVAAEVPDVRVLVVGDGPLSPAYQTLARRSPVDVEFLGEVGHDEIPRIFRCADVLVAPSTGSESFGIIHLEAMASGVPIVASDIAGYREILDGREALLFPNRRSSELASQVARVLTNPPLARAMGAAGRRKALAYSWEGIARRLEELYLELVDRKQRIRLAS